VFANHREEDEIYPLTTIEIAGAQKRSKIKDLPKAKCENTRKEYRFQLIEDTEFLCKDKKLMIPAFLQHRAAWCMCG
jgi:hypothetical protein